MNIKHYILDKEHHPRVVDLGTWAKWMERPDVRQVALTQISKEISVSTVFLGLDYNWGDSAPILFETLIFGGPRDGDMWRYATWDQALTGHNHAVDFAKTGDIDEK